MALNQRLSAEARRRAERIDKALNQIKNARAAVNTEEIQMSGYIESFEEDLKVLEQDAVKLEAALESLTSGTEMEVKLDRLLDYLQGEVAAIMREVNTRHD